MLTLRPSRRPFALLAPLALACSACATAPRQAAKPAPIAAPSIAAIARPAALYGWIKTAVLLRPRRPLNAEGWTTLLTRARQRLAPRRVRVQRHGERLVVGLARRDDVRWVRRALLDERPRLRIARVDDSWPTLPQLIAHLAAKSPFVTPLRDSFSHGGKQVAIRSVVARDSNTLRRALAALPATLRAPAGRRYATGPTRRGGAPGSVLYLLRLDDLAVALELASARVVVDREQRPELSIVLTAKSRLWFEKLTELAVGRRVGIVLDDTVLSAPVVQEKIRGGRIRFNGAEVHDPKFRRTFTEQLARRLTRAPLPSALQLVAIEALAATKR